MPFTPAHPALVLPFLKIDKRYVSASALVIGSMVPDFEYFFRFGIKSHFSHTLPGIFYFDIPVTLLLAIAFHLVVKKNLVSALPRYLQSRLVPLSTFDFLPYLKQYPHTFLVCAAIGAYSHIFWDGFTHITGYFVQHVDLLRKTFIHIDRTRYPLWYSLQHISSVVGLVIIAFYVAFLKSQPIRIYKFSVLLYWMVVVAIMIFVITIWFLVSTAVFNLGNFVVTCVSGFCIALLVGGLLPLKRTM
jgi:hypothetical protein